MTAQSAIIDDPKFRPVLDHGFVGLVDSMGDDAAIVSGARVSYGKGTKSVLKDRDLIRYLMRHRHTSPFELVQIKLHVKAPILVIRQWFRHRTACLSGDTLLDFDLPNGVKRGGRGRYRLSVEQVFERFQPTRNKRKDKQKNPYFKRERVQGMMLRSCDELRMSPIHTRIVDIWQSGVKPVWRVEFADGEVLRATRDHLCLTSEGWLKLGDALDRGVSFARFSKSTPESREAPPFDADELAAERWVQVNDMYSVSDLGRVRSHRSTRGSVLSDPRIKKPTLTPAGYHVVSLSECGVSRAVLVHRLVLSAFGVENSAGTETRHLDGNPLNNRLSNLAYGTAAENASDRMLDGCDQTLSISMQKPISFAPDGETMTYDLSVAGPFHNFSAAGTVVHNSVNEMSARYSEMEDEFYLPRIDIIQPQSQDNKQGRAGELSDRDRDGVRWMMTAAYEHSHDTYKALLGKRDPQEFHGDGPIYDAYDGDEPLFDEEFPGIARELARAVLPVGGYSEFYWSQNLHNMLHFLTLRSHGTAQWEIRQFAEAMIDIVRGIAPMAVEAWEDYVRYASHFSKTETNLLLKLIDAGKLDAMIGEAGGEDALQKSLGLSKREWKEFRDKITA